MLKTPPILHMFAPYWTIHACSVWSPYHQQNISKIEMVQRRAARFVTNNYDWNASVSDMLQHLQWEPLQDRRNNFHAITM